MIPSSCPPDYVSLWWFPLSSPCLRRYNSSKLKKYIYTYIWEIKWTPRILKSFLYPWFRYQYGKIISVFQSSQIELLKHNSRFESGEFLFLNKNTNTRTYIRIYMRWKGNFKSGIHRNLKLSIYSLYFSCLWKISVVKMLGRHIEKNLMNPFRIWKVFY